jgi:hypothetical protein
MSYIPLATVTLASNSVSVTFSNIPAIYKDLVMVGNWTNSSTASAGRLQVNGDSGANYNGAWMTGNGSTTGSGSESSQTSARIAGAISGPDNAYTNMVTLQFIDYAATDKHKIILSRFGSANRESQATTSRWASTSAITSIRFFDILGQTFQAGATFSLYGVV